MRDTVPEGQRLLAALGAAADIAYAWNVRTGAVEWLSDPTGLGAQFASIRTADALSARIHGEDATLRAAALAPLLATTTTAARPAGCRRGSAGITRCLCSSGG